VSWLKTSLYKTDETPILHYGDAIVRINVLTDTSLDWVDLNSETVLRLTGYSILTEFEIVKQAEKAYVLAMREASSHRLLLDSLDGQLNDFQLTSIGLSKYEQNGQPGRIYRKVSMPQTELVHDTVGKVSVSYRGAACWRVEDQCWVDGSFMFLQQERNKVWEFPPRKGE